MIYQGNALDVLKTFPGESIDCIITSPPYWKIRRFPEADCIWGGEKGCQHEWQDWEDWKRCTKCDALYGQLGWEPSTELYLKHLMEIIKELYRILKSSGTFFLNIGDTYWRESLSKSEKWLKRKSLSCIPWRLAGLMVQHGWVLRNVIVWFTPNAIGEPAKDRFSNRWEPLFFFTKHHQYYFDLDSVRVPHKPSTLKCVQSKPNGPKRAAGIYKRYSLKDREKARERLLNSPGANPGDVWEIATQPFSGAHFAVFPLALAERCILAGCPEDGVVLDPFCGSGTVLVAAKKLGRRYIGIEIVEEYVEMTKQRLKEVPASLWLG